MPLVFGRSNVSGPRSRALSMLVAALAAAAAFVIGVRHGTFAPGDTDPYGYVSAAELLASGRLHVDQRFALSMPWREAEASFIPPAYKRATVEGFAVPSYPLGLPLVMAGLLRLTGAREAVFYAVPLCGALMVWSTALLGARVHAWPLGAAAAVLLVLSPSFLWQVTQPVSDVPAAAWWTLALVQTLTRTPWAGGLAGLAAAMAILTRPNLAPLAAPLAGMQLFTLMDARGAQRSAEWRRLAFFVSGVAAGGLAVAATNAYLYGSPLASGYVAPISDLYSFGHVPENLGRYPRWLIETQTPAIALAAAAPWLLRRRADAWLLLAIVAVVFVSYLPFGYFDQWVYLRFLLSAYPPLLVLSLAVALVLLARALPPRRVVPAAIVGLAAVAGWQIHAGDRLQVLHVQEVERRYIDVGRYAAAMGPDAMFIAGLHAGSIRYYSGRPNTVYFESLHFRVLETAVAAMHARGQRPLFVLEEGEEPRFQWRFADWDLGALDWPPLVETRRGVGVRIYDPADRARFHAGEPVLTYDLHGAAAPVVTTKAVDK